MHAASRRPAPGSSPARHARTRTLKRLDAWRARALEQLERLMARVEHDPPPLAEPRLALLRRSREWLVSDGLPEPPEPAA